MEDIKMKEFKYVVTDNEGIHARPAGELVKLVKGFESTISIEKEVSFYLLGLKNVFVRWALYRLFDMCFTTDVKKKGSIKLPFFYAFNSRWIFLSDLFRSARGCFPQGRRIGPLPPNNILYHLLPQRVLHWDLF